MVSPGRVEHLFQMFFSTEQSMAVMVMQVQVCPCISILDSGADASSGYLLRFLMPVDSVALGHRSTGLSGPGGPVSGCAE